MPSLIWFTIIVPILLIFIFVVIPSLRQKIVWWEFLIPFGITIITIIVCQTIAIKTATRDKEYWGFIGYSIVHNEPFSYDSECPETYQCGTSCDSKGNCTPVYCTRWVHCVESSSRRCFLIDNQNNERYISYSKYKELETRWNKYQYTVAKIITNSHGYKTVGDKYNRTGHGHQHQVFWDQKWQTSEPIVIERVYENKVQTMSHWGEVSKEEKRIYELFDYPVVPEGLVSISTLSNGPTYPKSDKYLRYLNGILNTKKHGFKKVRIWVLVWRNQPQDAAELQMKYWKNGNKNEFTIMFGIDDNNKIMWHDIMTWSESDELTIKTRDYIEINMKNKSDTYSGKLTDNDLVSFYNWLGKEIENKYIKPDFEKYDFINVQPSMTALLISFVIVLIINLATGIFIIKNPWQD